MEVRIYSIIYIIHLHIHQVSDAKITVYKIILTLHKGYRGKYTDAVSLPQQKGHKVIKQLPAYLLENCDIYLQIIVSGFFLDVFSVCVQ